MPVTATSDVLVLGGGVIGLSVAYELGQAGLSVSLLERDEVGRGASWAGAGVLPPASWYVDHPTLDTWAIAARPMHAALSAQLLRETGVDDEYRACGADYRSTRCGAAALGAIFDRWRRHGVEVSEPRGDETAPTYHVPGEAQVRNPRRLQALAAACRLRGVRIVERTGESLKPERDGPSIRRVRTSTGDHVAGSYCFAAGCWTPALVASAGGTAPGRPIRGQMLLLRPAEQLLDRVVHLPPYYAVPRADRRVLVGATVEDVGFDARTTAAAQAELLGAAEAIDRRLAAAPVEGFWSGLRPASGDGLPIVGRVPGLENAWLATGHHRSGLQLAPPTARAIRGLILGEPIDLPCDAFAPGRFVRLATAESNSGAERVTLPT